MTPPALHIAIVGGSIAGCATAIAVARAGHRVEVFERSTGALQGRGAGIGTPAAVIAAFRERGMIDDDVPVLHVERVAHIGRFGDAPLGRTGWVAPTTVELLDWGALYGSLRRRVPNALFHTGRHVTFAAAIERGRVRLSFADGPPAAFDLVVFADGYRSLGRRLVCPGATLEYRGYVLWRGVLEEREVADVQPLEATLHRVGYPGGHLTAYLVPGPDRSGRPGTRCVNWGCYVRLSPEDLPRFLTGRDGRPHAGLLPPGGLRFDEEVRLKRLAREVLPPYHAAIVEASRDTFVQAIFTADVSCYRRGRLCLAGDAGAFVQPFTASGVFKSMNNGLALAEALAAGGDVDAALEDWSERETARGRRLVALGQRLEQVLIWNVPDFASSDTEALQAWGEDAARMLGDLFPPGGAT